MHPEPPASLVAEPKSSNKGCWLAGCGGCLGIVLICAAAFGLLYRSIRKELAVAPFTPVVLSPPEQQVLQTKVEAVKLVSEGRPPAATFPGIRITEQEVNAWIASQAGDMADALRVDFEKDSMTVVALIGDDPQKRMRIRGTVLLRHTPGKLEVELTKLRLGGVPLPSFLTKAATGGEAVQRFLQDKGLRTLLEERVEKIEFQKDAFLFVPKAPLPLEQP